MRSHLSPYSSRSPSGSAGASSRSALSHSRGHAGSSGASLVHSNSVSFDDARAGRRHLGEAGEVGSPPLSAVFPGRGFPGASPPGTALGHRDGDEVLPPLPPAYAPRADSASVTARPSAATMTGTVTSSGTRATGEESLTDLSVTTSQTDPITGAVVHFPRVPWRSGAERAWGERPLREDTIW